MSVCMWRPVLGGPETCDKYRTGCAANVLAPTGKPMGGGLCPVCNRTVKIAAARTNERTTP